MKKCFKCGKKKAYECIAATVYYSTSDVDLKGYLQK